MNEVRARYREQFPLLAAFDDIIAERNSDPARSINELWMRTDSVDSVTATSMALARIGRPARDKDDAHHAYAFIQKLKKEIADHEPEREKAIADYAIDALYSYAGCMPTAEDWLDDSQEDQEGYIDDVMEQIPKDCNEQRRLLREMLTLAMPTVLRQITAEDQARRRKLGLSVVPRT